MMIERPFPRLSAVKSVAMIGCAVIVPASVGIVAVHYQSQILVFVSALVLIATVTFLSHLYYHRRRCPTCGDLLICRDEMIGDSKQARCFLDCRRCQVTWNTGDQYEIDDAA
jgi:hypothetical protein